MWYKSCQNFVALFFLLLGSTHWSRCSTCHTLKSAFVYLAKHSFYQYVNKMKYSSCRLHGKRIYRLDIRGLESCSSMFVLSGNLNHSTILFVFSLFSFTQYSILFFLCCTFIVLNNCPHLYFRRNVTSVCRDTIKLLSNPNLLLFCF